MKIKLLDTDSLGMDTPLDVLSRFGEVEKYTATSDDEICERVSDAEVIIINKVKITERVFAAAPLLRLVCVFATGYDNIDISAARKHGVAVCNVPGYSTDSVALYTVATVLSLVTHLGEYRNYVVSGEYSASGAPNRLVPVYHEIAGKCWGILGYGNIGSAVAKVAEALGARVLVTKRTPTEERECVDVDTLCRECDIITVHCPLNEQTRAIINDSRISLMKKNVVLVNEARGAVLDEAAVAKAVEEGRIAAFGCDVYSREPLPDDHPYQRIKAMDNVILTPHAAWGSYESRVRCINIISENIEAFVSGKIKNRVDI